MAELRETRSDSTSRTGSQYERSENQNIKNCTGPGTEEKCPAPPEQPTPHQEKQEACEPEEEAEEYSSPREKENAYPPAKEGAAPVPDEESPAPDPSAEGASVPSGPNLRGPFPRDRNIGRAARVYSPHQMGRPFRSNSTSAISLLGLGRAIDAARDEMSRGMPREALTAGAPGALGGMFKKDEREDSTGSDDGSASQRLNRGRKKIKMEFIKDKGRRGVTFSKRKKGIMKKAYELNVLTKCEILLVVASETGHVYTFATPKLQPIIRQHENLIQQYLNGPSPAEDKLYEGAERFAGADGAGYYKGDGYAYEGIHRGHGYPSGYYQGGYDASQGGSRM